LLAGVPGLGSRTIGHCVLGGSDARQQFLGGFEGAPLSLGEVSFCRNEFAVERLGEDALGESFYVCGCLLKAAFKAVGKRE